MDALTTILSVFMSVGEWIVNAITKVIPIFYVEKVAETPGHLTFLGVLAVAGLAFSVVFLLIGIIQRFLKFQA